MDLRLDQSTLHPGEEITIYAQVAADAYLHIFNVDANGAVTVMMPNKFRANNFVNRGETLEDKRNGIQLKVNLPANLPETLQTVVVIATRQQTDLVGSDFKEWSNTYSSGETGLFEALVQKLWSVKDTDWEQGLAAYRVTTR